MWRLVKRAVAAVPVVLALALGFPQGAGARTNWVCQVPGEPEPVTFVSAADAAFNGISKANEQAGAVFGTQFGESCTVEPG
jgi:hypothetical protein